MSLIATQANNDSVAVGTSNTTVLAENNSRIGLTISNISDTDIYLGFGEAAVVGKGTYLKANGGSLTLDNTLLCQLAIYAISASSSKNVSFTEFLNKII